MPQRLRRAKLEQDTSKLKTVELSLELISLEADKDPPAEFRVLKKGLTQTSKGIYNFTDSSAKKCMEAAATVGNDFPIDYGHAMHSYLAVDPSEAGKAAGWFKPEVRLGELWATAVRWTPKAKQMLTDREYRYFSPVFHHSDDGEVQDLVSVGLTNIPATYGQEPLMASRAGDSTTPPTQENKMDRNLLIALLSLSKDATDADITTALKTRDGAMGELAMLTGQKDAAGVVGAVKAWKSAADGMPVLAQKVAELEKKDAEAKLSALIDAAKREGRLTPAMEPGVRAMPLEQVPAFLAALPVQPGARPATEPTPGTPGVAGGVVQLTAEEQHVARLLGNDPKGLAELRANTQGVFTAPLKKKTEDAPARK